MKLNSSLLSLAIAAAALMTVGFACGSGDETKPAANAPATNQATNQTAGSANKTESSTKPATTAEIAGNYAATGKNANGGGDYAADLVVTKRDDVYQFSWSSKGNKYDGVGVVTGDKVAVSYTDGANGKGCGVALYKINADGSLDGKAGYWGTNTSETERAVRKSGGDLEGAYEIKGTNPDGDPYESGLNVTKKGQGYEFNWTGQNAFRGFGVRMGDFVSVGFGGSNCAFVAYEIKPDGTLEGKWGSAGSTEFGTETAKKK